MPDPDLDAWLAPLPPDRRDRVRAWLEESRSCISCGETIARHEATRERDEGHAHARCVDQVAAAR